jgi:hypothetical protein
MFKIYKISLMLNSTVVLTVCKLYSGDNDSQILNSA